MTGCGPLAAINLQTGLKGRSRSLRGHRETLTTEIQHIVSTCRWQAFSRTAETAEHFFLTSYGGLVIVPKRAFSSADDIDLFRALASTAEVASDAREADRPATA